MLPRFLLVEQNLRNIKCISKLLKLLLKNLAKSVIRLF